jgi:hypothetical protein
LWNCDCDCANSHQSQYIAAYDIHEVIPARMAVLQSEFYFFADTNLRQYWYTEIHLDLSSGPRRPFGAIKPISQLALFSDFTRCPTWVCACKGSAFQWVQAPPGNRSSRKQSEHHGGNEVVEAFDQHVTNW